jgi:FkbM family methyltransferase
MRFSLLDRARVLHRAWRYTRRTEVAPVRFMRSFLKPGMTAVDVGANKGAYTFWMCRRVGRTGTVVAFEPQPNWAEYVTEIGRSFHFPQLQVVTAGLSSSDGERSLVRPNSNPNGGASFELESTGPGATLTAQAVRMDTALKQLGVRQVDFIKIDVEGHEYDVLAGGTETLERYKPAMVLECQDHRHPEGQTTRVFGMLDDLGYAGNWFDAAGNVRPISEFSVTEHQARDGRPYLDNFLFLPRT